MKLNDFRGFRFGKIHTSDLHLEVVSTSNRYEARILPAPTDITTDISGGDGQYYFGSTYKNREITCEVAFDSVSEQDYRKIRQLFATDKLLDLVFDEEPYKTWKAKLKNKPEFKSLCFTDKETGKRVYKGSGKLTFICYFPYAFGFDKYVVRAADYYLLNPPRCIIEEAQSDETFVKNSKQKPRQSLTPDTKYHYNLAPSDYEGGTTAENIALSNLRDKEHRNKEDRDWSPNDDLIWKSGFPTIDQVVAGELFFDTDQGEKTLIDVRGYWDNIPEWQDTAKLLTTPTLDFEQELIYLPQYSKTNYINMEMGFNNCRSMIGSRVLVYNPGDLPVDWEIRFNENKRGFWSCRGGTKFRVRRFNVERLPIPAAVDWCGLTTQNLNDNEDFKYGNKYFKRCDFDISSVIKSIEALDETNGVPNNLKILKPNIVPAANDSYEQFYTKNEIISLLKMGHIPVDKIELNDGAAAQYNPYSITKNWKELLQEPHSIDDIDFKNSINDNRAYSKSFDLRLTNDTSDWNKHLLKNFHYSELGLAHPTHCYYVEPIPRQKLDDYIKSFYWQTLQWRGEEIKDQGYVINWKNMLPEDFFNKEDLENGIYYPADPNNPLIDFLSNFIKFPSGHLYSMETIPNNRLSLIYKDLDFEEGIAFANRYRELLDQCVDEMEEFELYWDTLKKLLLKFTPMFEFMDQVEYEAGGVVNFNHETVQVNSFRTIEERINDFINSYINCPPEFLGSDLREFNYGEEVFNGYRFPQWMTNDYMEIDQRALSGVTLLKEYLLAIGEDEDAIFNGKVLFYTKEQRDYLLSIDQYSSLVKQMDSEVGIDNDINSLLDSYYFLNSETRMLYTTRNPYGMEFVYKPKKIIMNDAITQGNWFKIPPGWSLLSVEPIVDETLWGGKRWEDARPFDWGYGGDYNRNKREPQQLFDFVFKRARQEFFKYYPVEKIQNEGILLPEYLYPDASTFDGGDWKEQPIEEYLKFRVWYQKYLELFPPEKYYFINSYYRKLRNDAEYTLLKIINDLWSIVSPYYSYTSSYGVYIDPDQDYFSDFSTVIQGGPDKLKNIDSKAWPGPEDYAVTGQMNRCINGNIGDWWWYACNYIWSNFPPLYWAMADMLNNIQIKYIPLFY